MQIKAPLLYISYKINNANKGAASKRIGVVGRRHIPAACPIGVDPSVQSLLNRVVVKVRLDVVVAARVVAGQRLTQQKEIAIISTHLCSAEITRE